MTREEVATLLQRQTEARLRLVEPAPAAQVALDMGLETGVVRAPVALTLPLPPSVNRYFSARAMPTNKRRKTAAGFERVWVAQAYKSPEVEEYHQLVDAQARREKWPAPFPLSQMLRLTGVVAMARAGCDLDDRFKVLFDALTGRLYEDDEQVAELSFRRVVDAKRPRVELVAECIAVDRYGNAK